jgi:hypothetical protein
MSMRAVKLSLSAGLARLRPVGQEAWSLYWLSGSSLTIIAVRPRAAEAAIAARSAKWRHVVIDEYGPADGPTIDEPLDKPSLLDLLRFTDYEVAFDAVQSLDLELTASEADRLATSLRLPAAELPIAEVPMVKGEYTLAHLGAGWALVGYNKGAGTAVGVAFRPDAVYAMSTRGKRATYLAAARDGRVEIVET